MAASATTPKPTPRRRSADETLTGIIDIGSNSIRLVVYRGRHRTPPILFNEKVMAGLGRGVAASGRISDEGLAVAEEAIARFALLCEDMGVHQLRAVATAAVREASNSKQFLSRIRKSCGLEIEVISGEAEARYAALGVLAGMPGADGVVGDLGGGSLELIRIADGRTHERVSLPIGSLKLDAVRKKGPRALTAFVKKALAKVEWAAEGKGKPFYMVGGSWRALAQLHMFLTEHPLPVVHQYAMTPATADRLVRAVTQMQTKTLKMVPNISSSRVPSLPGAAVLLRAVTQKLGSSKLVASAYGLREGLLFDTLPPDIKAQDPLVAAARAEGERQGRFPEHGDIFMEWMNGLFEPETAADKRLRHVACLLSDVAWRAHPDFRAERAVDVALHGNWTAITTDERAMLAASLFACFGGSAQHPIVQLLHHLADAESLRRAWLWGLALRLGQRLSGGTAEALEYSHLYRRGGDLVLTLNPHHAALYGDTVARRLKSLAQAMELSSKFEVV
ncbi:exopolyphosphatase [Sphingoaurantiacus capsulatus]|uniref:exopolyphosphatase n=1 Tax=Sphingoaurantiacus capsulatus TaxID=1771310 RepID=A0ABV7XC23_9SPHN